MPGPIPHSAIFRTAIATHASLSATSLIYAALGPSQFAKGQDANSPRPPSPDEHSHDPSQTATSQSPLPPEPVEDKIAEACSALPWIDQLHNVIANMYIGKGAHSRGQKDNVMVQIHPDASFENPIISYSGVGEIERAFRGRIALHPTVNTLLECVGVEASEDSGAGIVNSGENWHHHQDEGTLNPSIIGIPSQISSSPPKIEVKYMLSQNYGSFFSAHSMLVVTVQVRSGCPGKMRTTKPGKLKVGIPIATSSYSGIAVGGGPSHHATLVAEVVRIEERWNGVQLLKFAPFHWSRRLNGMTAGGLAYLLFS